MHPEHPEVPEMTVTELERRLEDEPSPVLLDVREGFEREIADLPDVGQRHIPRGEVPDRLDELDPDRTLVVYCRTGARSERVVRLLQGEGFEDVWNLKGGLMAWREEVDPSLKAY